MNVILLICNTRKQVISLLCCSLLVSRHDIFKSIFCITCLYCTTDTTFFCPFPFPFPFSFPLIGKMILIEDPPKVGEGILKLVMHE